MLWYRGGPVDTLRHGQVWVNHGMFELADEIGREHVRLLWALARTKSVREMTNGAEEDAGRVYCAVGDVKERKLIDRQRQAIIAWAHGHSIPYVQGKDALSKLETIGFLTSKKHQMVYERGNRGRAKNGKQWGGRTRSK